MKKSLLAALLVVTGVAGTTTYSATTNMNDQEKIEYLTQQLEQSNELINELKGDNLTLENNELALIPAELETIEDLATEGVFIINEDNAKTEVIAEGIREEDQWAVSARTYIEREQFDDDGSAGGWLGESENIYMIGTGVNAVKGRLGLHLNVEQRLTGHVNSEGADNQNTRVDYKVRYQTTDQMGLHFKYRSERGTKKRDAWAAEQNRNRDRVELGTDFNFFDGYWSGWFVVGHDVDSANGVKGKGEYYEGDMGPTFQINEKLALRPTIYSTGEFYRGYGGEDTEFFDHQIRLMAIYKFNDSLTLIPRLRYSFDRTLDESSGEKNNIYEANYRVRAEFLFDYRVNDQISIDGGIAYDWQERDYNGFDEDRTIDMLWYYLAANYRF